MKINFIVNKYGYDNTIKILTKQIIKYLNDYQISNKCMDNMINVMFFLEPIDLNLWEFNQNKGINIFIQHGLADKNYFICYQEQLKKIDYCIVSGDIWKEKLNKMGYDKIIIGGSPKLDYLTEYQQKIKRISNLILYAPTHHNHGFNFDVKISSYPDFMYYLSYIDYNFMVSRHPYYKKTKQPTLNELLLANCVISCGGSIIYECLALEIPIIFPYFLVAKDIISYKPYSFEAELYKNKIGFHIENINQINNIIEKAMNTKQDIQTKEYINKIIKKDTIGNSGKIISSFLKQLN